MKKMTFFEVALIGSTPTNETDDLMMWLAVDEGVVITAESFHAMFPSVIDSVTYLGTRGFPMSEITVHFEVDSSREAYQQFVDIAKEKILSWVNRQILQIQLPTSWPDTKPAKPSSNPATAKTAFLEATVKGFDGESDETDDLVLWVAVDADTEITAELLQRRLGSVLATVVPMDPGMKAEHVMADVAVHFTVDNEHAANRQLASIAADLIRKHDKGLSAEQLDEKYNPEGNGTHPLFDRDEWGQVAAAGQTILGYWAWACEKVNEPTNVSAESLAAPSAM